MGVESVEVTVVDLSEEREQLLNLALNRISGEWDEPSLANLLHTLQSHEADVTLSGFDYDEMENLQMFLGDDYKKLQFKDIIDKFQAQKEGCGKNEQWFYVEFYSQDKKYQELLKLLQPHFLDNGKHEIKPDVFYDMVKKVLKR